MTESIEHRIERLLPGLTPGQRRELDNGATWEVNGMLFGLRAKCGWFTPVEQEQMEFDTCEIAFSKDDVPENFFNESDLLNAGKLSAKREAENAAREALRVGSRKFIVKYYYLASGMEGRADTYEVEVMAESASEAIEKQIAYEYPEDKMYGPENSFSARAFLRGCLNAREV